MPYLTERLFALAMTAVDVSAIGRSNVERPTRLRKATARQAPDVQSKARDRRWLIQRFSYDFAPGSPARLNEVRIRNSLTMAILTSDSGRHATERRIESAARVVCEAEGKDAQ